MIVADPETLPIVAVIKLVPAETQFTAWVDVSVPIVATAVLELVHVALVVTFAVDESE